MAGSIEQTDAELLAEARSALHNLVRGRSARVFVDQNGERIEYTAAREPLLRKYIADLEAAIAAAGVETGTQPPEGPLRVYF